VCGGLVSQWVNRWAVPVLRDAGCTVIPAEAPAAHPSRTPTARPVGSTPNAITESEIDRFIAALDEPAWDELEGPAPQ
jgi:hypothetical protein